MGGGWTGYRGRRHTPDTSGDFFLIFSRFFGALKPELDEGKLHKTAAASYFLGKKSLLTSVQSKMAPKPKKLLKFHCRASAGDSG
ncbi:hypothetical protein XELAEV_18042321mg [Xenopus laevis]|uniref:Uncharacterized protein n=1 Tax=Xenopus laevis TaxID=8355 RepID=A0A974C3U2_XENLA|nr:hypothetical protein XELAEV_18042321mg [Xenopus laevis]